MWQIFDQRHELRARKRCAPKPHKGTHDFDVVVYGDSTSQDAREHRDALFGESIGLVTPAAPAGSHF